MIEFEEILSGLWRFSIPLPDNPLRWLNCYVIRPEEGRALLIDTGFNRSECLQSLSEGMAALGLEPENTDVFVTHCHGDHVGCAGNLQDMGCRILMGRVDREIEQTMRRGREEFEKRAVAEGMPREIYELTLLNNHGRRFPSAAFTAIELEDGDELEYGSYHLRCMMTPGHTPGHLCLYEKEKKILFLGDHVLFDITPNIIAWPWMEDALGVYMENLRRVRDLPVDYPLPAHRKLGTVSLEQRVDQLLAHHEARLCEAEDIIRRSPGLNAYDVAGRMRWKIKASCWDDFPPGQKWFAFGETLAHLDRLVASGRLERAVTDGIARYKVI